MSSFLGVRSRCIYAKAQMQALIIPRLKLVGFTGYWVSLFDIVFRWSTRYNQVCLPERYKSHHKIRVKNHLAATDASKTYLSLII